MKRNKFILLTTLLLVISIVLIVLICIRNINNKNTNSTSSSTTTGLYNNPTDTQTKKTVFPQYDPKNYNPVFTITNKNNPCDTSGSRLAGQTYEGSPVEVKLAGVTLTMGADKIKDQYRFGEITYAEFQAKIAEIKASIASLNAEYIQNVEKWNAAVEKAKNEYNAKIVNGPKENCFDKFKKDPNAGIITISVDALFKL